MTPETRAARDRLAAFAQPGSPMPDLNLPDSVGPLTVTEVRRIVQQITRGMQETLAPDILLMLAALDRHEKARDPSTWREPCNVALSHTNGEITCQLAVSDPPPAGYLESGGRYTGNRNHWEKHWHQDEHGQVRTWTDNESEG